MSLAQPDEIKLLPAYTLADVARYIGSNTSTLRIWFRGRPSYEGKSKRRAIKPVFVTDAGGGEPLSFIDLVEAHMLLTIRKRYRNFPLKSVRTAIDYLQEINGNLMILASKAFCHDAKHVFIDIDSRLMSLSERGQYVDRSVMEKGLRQITYGKDGYAENFFPLVNGQSQKNFVINPRINFGRITIARLGIDARTVGARFVAGEKMADIAEDYNATEFEVEESLRWYGRLAA